MNTVTTPMVQPSFPVHHMGVERIELGLTTAKQMIAVMTPSRTLLLATLLVGTSLSVAIADAMLGTWGDEHLMLALVILVAVALASGALLLPTAAALTKSVRLLTRRAQHRLQVNHREAMFWNAAVADPRMMRELETLSARQAGDFGCASPAQRAGRPGVFASFWQQWTKNRAQVKADAYTWASAQQDPRLMADLQAAMGRSQAF